MNSSSIGSLVYATEQGLGILAKQMVEGGVIDKVLVVNHPSHENFGEVWYPGALQTPIQINSDTAFNFLNSVDALLFLETPFAWELVNRCRVMNKPTTLMVMHECTPKQLPAFPDRLLCPSKLDEHVCSSCGGFNQNCSHHRFFPVPTGSINWRPRHVAEVFVHNAGNGGLAGRNGTLEVVQAWQYLDQSGIRPKLILRIQPGFKTAKREQIVEMTKTMPHIDCRVGTEPYDTLYQEGDVFIFPERWNGLSLPLQEAYASGMLVMCLDRFPMNTWLPSEPLIPVGSYNKRSIGPAYREFDEAIPDPIIIADHVKKWWLRDLHGLGLTARPHDKLNWSDVKETYRNYILRGE